MSWLPRSPKARRRLWIVAAATPILVLATGLSLWAMNDNVTYFFSPSEATPDKAPAGRSVRLGGLVEAGSVVHHGADVAFSVTDNAATTRVTFHGDLPDLFREGQGIVAEGTFQPDRSFVARQVLAKHDETYMPKEVADRLKAKGEWRPEARNTLSNGETQQSAPATQVISARSSSEAEPVLRPTSSRTGGRAERSATAKP